MPDDPLLNAKQPTEADQPSSDTAGQPKDHRLWFQRPVFALPIVVLCLGLSGLVIYDKAGQARGIAADAKPSATEPKANMPTGPKDKPIPSRSFKDLFDLSGLKIKRELIKNGGPGIDGIPAITTAAARADPDPHKDNRRWRGEHAPEVLSIQKAKGLDDKARVVGVTIGKQSRAYPIAVLNFHECVNDVLGKVPIAVTYCPLCDSVTVIDRRVGQGKDAKTLEFGISGYLYNSNVLLYDRQERGLWSQIRLEAVCGPRAGAGLKHLDGWSITTLEQWRKKHPDSDLLTFKTGYKRNYNRTPYKGYDKSKRIWFPIERRDDALGLKQRIIGVIYGGQAYAFPIGTGKPTIEHDLGDGKKLVIEHQPSGEVSITKQPEDARVIHTFWFAWAASHPETKLVR